jgi:hypothetical protein
VMATIRTSLGRHPSPPSPRAHRQEDQIRARGDAARDPWLPRPGAATVMPQRV